MNDRLRQDERGSDGASNNGILSGSYSLTELGFPIHAA